MSEKYECAVERKIVAKHELMSLRVRCLVGDDVPSADEWSVALAGLYEASLGVAMAEVEPLLRAQGSASRHQTRPGSTTMVFTTMSTRGN